MGAFSDQAAADRAEAQDEGGGGRGPRVPPLLVIEPARQKVKDGQDWCYYVEPLELLFCTWAPICDTCHEAIIWTGAPKRLDDGWEYRIYCGCGVDFIESAFPLRIYANPAGSTSRETSG